MSIHVCVSVCVCVCVCVCSLVPSLPDLCSTHTRNKDLLNKDRGDWGRSCVCVCVCVWLEYMLIIIYALKFVQVHRRYVCIRMFNLRI